MSNEIQANTGKKKFEMKRVGEGNGKIWDLKYKISEDLKIKMKKKWYNNYPIHNQQAKIAKCEDRTQVF